MTQPQDDSNRDQLYVAARRALLDGLEALAEQREAVILVGAQAVYRRSQDAELIVAPFTTDADLSIDPRQLSDLPLLETAMRSAGFEILSANGRHQPGQWIRSEQVGDRLENIAVDLLVPELLVGSAGRRGARIPPHDRLATRKVPGLEPAVVDNDLMQIGSLEEADNRILNVKVAGVAALLTAKAYKIHDRLADPRPARLTHKDAGDVVRLMMTSDAEEVAETFAMLFRHDDVSEPARQGLIYLRSQFQAEQTPGTRMAIRALEGAMSASLIEALCRAFVDRLPRPV